MTQFTITTAVSQADLEVIYDGLDAHSAGQAPPYEKHDLAVLLRQNGRLQAALVGHMLWGWLYIRLLWVDDRLRGQGVGRQLVKTAENEAQRQGCRAAYVNTFSYQAPGFYQKLGYQLFGQLDDFPPGHQRLFLKKVFDKETNI